MRSASLTTPQIWRWTSRTGSADIWRLVRISAVRLIVVSARTVVGSRVMTSCTNIALTTLTLLVDLQPDSLVASWSGTKVPTVRAPEHRGPRRTATRFEDMAVDPAASDPIRVYLLDDHEIVRRGLKDLLESAGDIVVVGESGLAAEATRHIPALRPDVAILDGRLPDGSGIDVCREIRSRDPGIAVLILTSYDDDEALFSAIMAGASGYILKQVGGNDFVETVRRVAAGQSMLDPPVTAPG